jgi:uncharacterized protein DUF2505
VTTEFSYETVFEASGRLAVLAAYFDDDHLATQDKVAELTDRKVIESHEDAAIKKTSWSVRSLRPLPMFVRPFVEGGRLAYVETMTWRKADDEIDLEIIPQVANGRVRITAVYQLADIAPGKVRRRYRGAITVQASLLSGKIERAIAGELEQGMPKMTECTQSWLRLSRR